jgi:hypothetical protein
VRLAALFGDGEARRERAALGAQLASRRPDEPADARERRDKRCRTRPQPQPEQRPRQREQRHDGHRLQEHAVLS